MTNQLPEGYMANPHGHLVPVDSIDDLDLLRNDVVIDTVRKAQELRQELAEFKQAALNEMELFVNLAAEKYDTKLGGTKGNLTLMSFDGKYKLMVSISDSLMFDERLQIAKQLIDECIHSWTENSDSNVKALIEHAFQTDKQGNINTARVLGLLKLKISDAKWKQGMEALKDSISVASSKSYLRLYERVGTENKYQQISLDIASL